jgi:hypothetical protein
MKHIIIAAALVFVAHDARAQATIQGKQCWGKEFLVGSNERFGDVFATFNKNDTYSARNTKGYAVSGNTEKNKTHVWFTWTNGNVTKIIQPKC